MILRTPTMNENGGFSLGTFFPRDSSFPRTRESRFVSASISLDTRFRGYDGNAAVYFGIPGSSFYSSSTHGIFEGGTKYTKGVM